MAWSLKKIALVGGGVAIGSAACFFTAGAAAPFVGSLLGGAMGLSGAAATSAGLATLGGGALAAGGGGMAAGAALVMKCLVGAGALLGGLGMGTMANFFRDSNKEFEKAIGEQKDFAKAQEIIKGQESKVQELQAKLAAERSQATNNAEKIRKLEKAVDMLTQVVSSNKDRLRKAQAA